MIEGQATDELPERVRASSPPHFRSRQSSVSSHAHDTKPFVRVCEHNQGSIPPDHVPVDNMMRTGADNRWDTIHQARLVRIHIFGQTLMSRGQPCDVISLRLSVRGEEQSHIFFSLFQSVSGGSLSFPSTCGQRFKKKSTCDTPSPFCDLAPPVVLAAQHQASKRSGRRVLQKSWKPLHHTSPLLTFV